MSKTIKRKITVELPKVKDLKNRPSVFERLGNKKKSNNSVSVSFYLFFLSFLFNQQKNRKFRLKFIRKKANDYFQR